MPDFWLTRTLVIFENKETFKEFSFVIMRFSGKNPSIFEAEFVAGFLEVGDIAQVVVVVGRRVQLLRCS